MIVLLSNSGQMCNQLMDLSAAYSLGLEKNEDVLCPIMDEKLKEYFCFQRDDNSGINVTMCNKLSWSIVAAIKKMTAKVMRDSGNKEEYDPRKKNHYFYSWLSCKDDYIFMKHLPEVRAYFAFRKEIEQTCMMKMKDNCDNKKKKIGVHMRRGDYKSFNGGKYYYTDKEYAKWMKQLNSEEDVQFLLFSNEEINVTYFNEQGLNVCAMNGSSVEDLCCLSKCDYIMGPPSTYSGWAALIGNKRRLFLDERDKEYTLADFRFWEDGVKEKLRVDSLWQQN